MRASAHEVSETSTQRLATLVAKVGARTYLAGGGAQGYQRDETFEQRGLSVLYQRFTAPTCLLRTDGKIIILKRALTLSFILARKLMFQSMSR